MSKFRSMLAIVALAIPLTAAPAVAESEPLVPVVSGEIVLPEGFEPLPLDETVTVALQDTSLADAMARDLARLWMAAPDASSPIPFALSYAFSVDTGPTLPTLNVRIEDADGNLLYINDTVTYAFDAAGPLANVVVEMIAVG